MLERLKSISLLKTSKWIGVIVFLLITLPPAILNWHEIYFKIFKPATDDKYPITGIVAAHHYGLPNIFLKNSELMQLNKSKSYVFIRIQNEGDKIIKDVKFNFATASFLEVNKGYKYRDGRSNGNVGLKGTQDLGDFNPGHVVDVSMWTTYYSDKDFSEEITDDAMKDINIIFPEHPYRAKMISLYTPEGKERFLKYTTPE